MNIATFNSYDEGKDVLKRLGLAVNGEGVCYKDHKDGFVFANLSHIGILDPIIPWGPEGHEIEQLQERLKKDLNSYFSALTRY